MRRTLPLVTVLALCGIGVGYSTTALGPAETVAPVEQLLDTSDRDAEPTGRTYPRPVPAAQPATAAAAPSSAVPVVAVTSAPAPAVPAVEVPAPAAVNPQPVPVTEPAPVVELEPVLDEPELDEHPVDDPCFRQDPECYDTPVECEVQS